MKRQGYWERFGLDPTIVNVADTSKIIGSLIGGDTDVCMLSGFAQAFPAIEKGARLKVLAGANALAPNSLFSSRPEIKSLKDLEGKTVGTGAIGAALHQITVALLLKNKVDVSKVTFVNIGTTVDIFKALIAGTVDAGCVNVDVYDQMSKYKIHPLADFFVDLADYPYQGSFAADSTIRSKREAIVRTLAAHAVLYRFISSPESKQAYVDAYVAGNNAPASQGEAQWNFVQKYKPYATNLVLSDESLQLVQQINTRTGVQKAVPPSRDVADMSLAQDALKLI
jgi:ABC-type nitrate/sulfonate/bicarbonate transport system substrate-binding protein